MTRVVNALRGDASVFAIAFLTVIVLLFAMVWDLSRDVDGWQAQWTAERVVRVRIETLCKSNPDGSAVCAPGTFADPRGTTTTTTTAVAK